MIENEFILSAKKIQLETKWHMLNSQMICRTKNSYCMMQIRLTTNNTLIV